MSHAAPVCAEIILRRRKVPAARKGSLHDMTLRLATDGNVWWKRLKVLEGATIKVNGSPHRSM